MRNIVLFVGVLGLVAAVGCNKKPQSAETGAPTEEAVAASKNWLATVDAERYGQSWDQAAEYFRNAVPKTQWERQVAAVRGPLGAVLNREVASAELVTSVPGAPDGEYVVIQYQTTFENKAEAIETVTPMRDNDGVFRVSGYYIR